MPSSILMPLRTELLRPYQVEDIEYMQEHRRVINANDMGLGKTVEAIHAMLPLMGNNRPTLIISSLGQKWFWRDEILDWSTIPDDQIEIVNSPTLWYDKELGLYKLVYIVHWDVLFRYAKVFEKIPWGVIIADEAHKAKNRKAGRTKGLWKVTKKAGSVFLLTGTPVVNQPDDLWSLLKALYPKHYTSYWRFFHEFTESEENYWGQHIVTGVHAKKLGKELQGKAFRRIKTDVLPQLPDKTQVTIPIQLSREEKKAYTEMRKYMITDVAGQEVRTPSLMGQEMKMREFCSGLFDADGVCHKSTKISWIMNTLEERVAAGKKTVISTMRRNILHELERRLTTAKIKYVSMHGGTPRDETRNNIVKQFQEDPDTMVIVLMIQVGGEGWTLTAGDMLIFVDRPWTPKDVAQMEDRLWRLTQKNAVTIVTLLAEGTVEERVEKTLADKTDIVQQVNARLEDLL